MNQTGPEIGSKQESRRSPYAFTRVSNAFVQDLLPQLSGNQIKVALWVLRQTVGYNRYQTPKIGMRSLSDALGIDKSTVARQISRGLADGWLSRDGVKDSFQYRLVKCAGRGDTRTTLYGGFTAVPNEFFHDYLHKLSGGELAIMVWLFRQTIGWRREVSDKISYSDLEVALGIGRRKIIALTKQLISQGLITRRKEGVSFCYQVTACQEFATDLSVEDERQTVRKTTPVGELLAWDSGAVAIQHQTCTQNSTSGDVEMRTVSEGLKKDLRSTERKETTINLIPSPQGSSSSSQFGKEQGPPDCQSKASVQNAFPRADSGIVAIGKRDLAGRRIGNADDQTERRSLLLDLPLNKAQIKKFAGRFDATTLRKGVAAVRNLNGDLGALLWSACKEGWEPRQDREEQASLDREWVAQTFGQLDGKRIGGRSVEFLSKWVEFVAGGSHGTKILEYGSKDFRDRVKAEMASAIFEEENRRWLVNQRTKLGRNTAGGYRFIAGDVAVNLRWPKDGREINRLLPYSHEDFRGIMGQFVQRMQVAMTPRVSEVEHVALAS